MLISTTPEMWKLETSSFLTMPHHGWGLPQREPCHAHEVLGAVDIFTSFLLNIHWTLKNGSTAVLAQQYRVIIIIMKICIAPIRSCPRCLTKVAEWITKLNTTIYFTTIYFSTILLGGSRKYPYPYHGRHLRIPKGRGGYVDWNSEGEGGVRRLEFRGTWGGGSLDWNSEGIRFSGE